MRLYGILLVLVTMSFAISPTANTSETSDTDLFPDQEGGFIGQTTLEFTTNRTFDVHAPIQNLLQNAQTHSLNLTLHASCNASINWRIGKCERAFFREDQDVTNFTALWNSDGVVYLLQATNENCYGGYYPDGKVHFVVKATKTTHCFFLFILSGLETNTTHWSKISTADPKFYFFAPSPSQPEDSFNVILLLSIAGVLVIVVSMFVAHCLMSDGLGDDVASDNIPGSGAAAEVPMEEIQGQERDIATVLGTGASSVISLDCSDCDITWNSLNMEEKLEN